MFIYWIYLPNLSTFTTGNLSFYDTTNLILSSIFSSSSHLLTDIPFKNGKYTHGGSSLSSLSRSSIQSDDSIYFFSFILFLSLIRFV